MLLNLEEQRIATSAPGETRKTIFLGYKETGDTAYHEEAIGPPYIPKEEKIEYA